MSIKIMSPNIVYLGAAKAPSGSNEPTTINLNYIQDTTPSNPQEKEVWYNTSDNKIYTYKNGQWIETGEATVGVWYYDTVNDKYYLWDGTSLEETELNIYEKIENKTDDFESTSSITYPSSKALSDGLQDTLDKSYKPNLFDIKTISEPIAQKGWCCISDSQPKRLLKSQVPTVYEFLKGKLSGIDSAASDTPTTLQSGTCYAYDCDDTYLYSTPDSYSWFDDGSGYRWGARLKRTLLSNLPLTNWENTNIIINGNDKGGKTLSVGDILICATDTERKQINIYKKSDFTLFKQLLDITDGTNKCNITKAVVDNKNTFFMSYYNSNNQYCLAKIEDSLSSDIEILTTNLDGITSNPIQIGTDTFIFCCNGKIYKTTNNFQTYTQISTTTSGSAEQPSSLYKINNNIVATGKDAYTSGYKISTDNGNTWVDGTPFVNISGVCPNGWCNGNELYVFVHVLSWQTCFLYRTGDLINWERVGNIELNGACIIVKDTTNNNIFYMTGVRSLNYIGMIKTIYTDTINGIDINYYKNGDWKICIAGQNNRSGGDTTDGKLQDVYDYLGYLNYWWIDTAVNNERITLQRNSNLWTMMYIGDDYEDSSLPSGNYLPYALKPLKYSNKVASMWSASVKYADYPYECAITCTGVTSSSIAQVIFALTEADSGNYATVCETSTNTVTIYSKVNTTITIPTILVQGV